jgi:intein/homing endonuclease
MRDNLTDDQKQLASRLFKELKADDRAFWNTLSDDEKGWFTELVAELTENGQSIKLKALYEQDFIRKVPTIREVLDANYEDDETGELTNYWLGPDGVPWTKQRGAGLYPYWRDALLEIFDGGTSIWEAIFTGPIGGGKCVAKGTLIRTDKGLEPIETVVSRHQSGDDPHVFTESGFLCKVREVHDEGESATKTIRTSRGYQLSGRGDHRVRVLNADLTTSWVRLRDVKTGDPVLIDRRSSVEGSLTDTDRAYFLGLLTGDGHVGDNYICITSADVDERLLESIERVAGKRPSLTKDKRTKSTYAVRVHSKELVAEMKELFPGKAHTKRVPGEVFRYNREALGAYLRGLYDTDGYCDGSRHIQLSTSSEVLGRQVQELLLLFGIVSKRKPTRVKGYDHTYWKIDIYGADNFITFAQTIGFAIPRKRAALDALLSGLDVTSRNSNREVIPGDYKEVVADLFRTIRREGSRTEHKKFAGLFMARTGQSLTRVALRQIVGLWREQVPEHIALLVDNDWFVDSVESIEDGSAHCYDLSVDDDPTYIASGFVTHNTTAAVIAQAYILIQLACLRDPHRYHGLMGGGPIVITICNVTQSRAKETAYGQLLYILNTSPFFRQHFPINTRQVFDPGAEGTDRYAIQLPRNIRIAVGARSNSAISANVISAILDEMSFKELKSAKSNSYTDMEAFKLYTQIRKRIESRFIIEGKKTPGLLCNVSSKMSTSSFLEKHIEAVRNSPKVKIYDDSIYKMKPPGTFSDKTFRVMVGDKLTAHRILADNEPAPAGYHVEEVPINFLDSFKLDLDGAVRDICGIATFGEQPLLRDREKLAECISKDRPNPFNGQIVAGTQDEKTLEDYLDKESLCGMWGMGYRPKHHPGSARFIHLDLSRTGDCTGVSMGCISEIKHIRRANMDGSVSPLVVPAIWFDFMLRIIPPQNGEIDYSKIRQLIFTLRDVYNFPIKKVTADQYQSADMLQLLDKAGFEVDVISMDRDDSHYLAARMAIMEGRVNMPMYEPFVDEITELVHDTTKAKGKVDHRAGASKDVADSWCGVIASIGMEETPDALMEPPKNPSIIMPAGNSSNYPGKSFVTENLVNYGDQLTDIKDSD